MHLAKNKNNLNPLLLFATLASLCLSLFAAYDSIPNNDAITYMNAAQAFLSSGFTAAKQVYIWPFYPVMIGLFSKYTSLSILHSAFVINAVLHTIIIYAFLNLFNKFNPTKQQLFFAALTILIFPQINEYRSFIIRDFGYLAFSLLGLNALLNYVSINQSDKINHRLFKIFSYYCFFIFAFLFRAEAIILMLALPLGILFSDLSKKEQFQKLWYIYLPIILLACLTVLVVILVFLINNQSPLAINIIKIISNTAHYSTKLYIAELLGSTYRERIDIINTYIFPVTHNNTLVSLCFLWFGLIAVVIAKFITIFNILNLIFLAVYIKNFSQYFEKINKNNFKLILFAFILNFLLPTGFLYLIFVITGRYYLLSAILLLLFVPFGMDYIWIKVNNLLDYPKFRILSQSCLIALLALLAADGITTFGYSKDYIKQAGLWYKAQNLPTETAIANNPQLAYFAELSNNSIEYDQLVPSQINKNYFSYLLIKIKYNDTNKLTQIKQLAENNQLIILNTFSNSRNDSVFICKLI